MDIYGFSLFQKEFELKFNVNRTEILKLYKKCLNKNNEMHKEEFIKYLEIIAKE